MTSAARMDVAGLHPAEGIFRQDHHAKNPVHF